MNIIERGPCERYAASLSPIKPWGVLLHTTEGGDKASLDYLFIHNRRYDGKDAQGNPKYTTVSVHFMVCLDGEVRAYAPWRPGKAWYTYHAGKSYMDGQSGVSRVLLGIEIQHKQGQAFPDVQIAALKELLATIQEAYRGQPYWRNVLTEHSVVAPGRKIDPTSPWSKVKAGIYAAWNGEGILMALTDKEQALLLELTKRNRLSLLAAMNADDIAIAIAKGDLVKAEKLRDAANAAAETERARLGLK